MRRSLMLAFLVAAALWSIAPGRSIALPAPPTDALMLVTPPEPAPTEAYETADGGEATLADLKGKVVVLNFWATWCAPCVRELPSLDRLAARLPNDRFAVLALSTDRGGAATAAPFLEKHGVETLAADVDKGRALSRALSLRGLPTTFILDADGRIVAKLEGVAEWDAPEFVAWLEELAGE